MDDKNIMKTGTTTVGIVAKDCIILAADKRATAGNFDIVLNYVLVHLFYAPGNRSGSNFASLAAAETFSGRKILLTAIEQTVKHIIRDYLGFATLQDVLS